MIKNKIQIIGLYGVVATGKSTLSHHLLDSFREADLVVTDNLLAIKRMQDSSPVWRHSSYNQWERFGDPNRDNLWKGFLEYRNGMEEFMACVLSRAKEQRVDMIFEGIHIDPALFSRYETDLAVNLFLLVIGDPRIHEERIREKCSYRPTLLRRLEEYFVRIRALQDLLIGEAKSQKVQVVDTGDNIENCLHGIREKLR